MSIKNRGPDLKTASVHDGPVVHGGAGHTLTHAVGCIAQAGREPPRRITPGQCVPVRRACPPSACRCWGLGSGDAAWPMATTCGPHPNRRNAGSDPDEPERRVADRHAASREARAGATDFTRGRDDSPDSDRRARHASRRASAPRNGMRDVARLITACNGRAETERAGRRRDTIRLSGGARDYVASGVRCRPFPGISVKMTGNQPCLSWGKVVFATD